MQSTINQIFAAESMSCLPSVGALLLGVNQSCHVKHPSFFEGFVRTVPPDSHLDVEILTHKVKFGVSKSLLEVRM